MSRIKLRRQSTGHDCGPVCLQMAAEYHGRFVPLADLEQLCQVNRRGTSLAHLADAAEALGFRTLVVRMPLEQLKRVNLPCIAYWGTTHFVIVEHVGRNYVTIADPNAGRLRYRRQQFLEGWSDQGKTGPVLLLEPTADFRQPGRAPTLGFFARYIAGHRRSIAQVLISIFFGSLLQLLIAFTARTLVDVAIPLRSMSFVYLVIGAQLVMFITRAVNDFLRSWIILHVSASTNFSILADFLKRLMHSGAAVFDRRSPGDILQRIGDHTRVQSFLTSSTVTGIAAIGNLCIFGAALCLLSLRVAVIFVVSSALLGVWMYLFAARRRDLDNRRFKQSSELQTALLQIIAGMRDIWINTCERRKREEWELLQAKQFRLNLSGLALTQRLQGGAMAVAELRNILITCIAANEVIRDQLTLGSLLAITYMIGSLSAPVDQLISFFQSSQDAKISIDRIAEIHSAAEDAPPKIARAATGADIVFDDVSFRYAASAVNALSNLHVRIRSGSRLAIVGPSGSGKSTLVKVLLKLYRVRDGSISVGGVPLEEIDTASWRRTCGVVLQDGYIFTDTLARNIALGTDTIEPDQLWRAIEVARLHDVVRRLGNGVEEIIGPRAQELSAGERQRILIARALYRNPDTVILDEATSALDGVTERSILDNLQTELSGKTVITIAHRLSTVMSADSVAVLESGFLTELGTHTELVSAKRSYYSLIRNQLEIGA